MAMFNSDVHDIDLLRVMNYLELDYLIENLPDGLNTQISNYSNPFSSGEKQRILLCRALLSDKEILLLDEPTSNLDQKTTNLIVNKLKESQRTVLFTTHNTQSLEFIDSVLNIEQYKR